NLGGSWSKVHAIAVDPAALLQEVVQGKLDGDCDAALVSEPSEIANKGVAGRFFPLSSAGIDPLGWGIVASTHTIDSNPALVKAFVAATLQGFQWAYAHPTQAVTDLRKMVSKPIDPYNVQVLSLKAGQQLVDKSVPFGSVPESDWASTTHLVSK